MIGEGVISKQCDGDERKMTQNDQLLTLCCNGKKDFTLTMAVLPLEDQPKDGEQLEMDARRVTSSRVTECSEDLIERKKLSHSVPTVAV